MRLVIILKCLGIIHQRIVFIHLGCLGEVHVKVRRTLLIEDKGILIAAAVLVSEESKTVLQWLVTAFRNKRHIDTLRAGYSQSHAEH